MGGKRKRGGNKKGGGRAKHKNNNNDDELLENQKQKQQIDIDNQEIHDEDDEEIDEDEAFNSDDERKYGHFFDDHDDNDDDDDSSSDEDDDNSSSDEDGDDKEEEEEEGDGGQYMLDLINRLDESNNNKKDRKQNPAAIAATQVPESEFATSVVRKGNLTLDSLMEGLQDTKGFGSVQKSMKKFVEGEATQVPVAKVVSKRAERKVHYEHQSKEISLWLDAVQQNRQAETLDFRPKERLQVTRDTLIEKFVPTTDFEKQLHAALEEAGQQDEEAIIKAEEAAFMAQQGSDDLGSNDQTLEEYKKRRGELAKLRALMFYHEQKRHRINKIKSKKYRRIRKKQRERAKEAEIEAQAQEDPNVLKELEEKEEIERMKERMTLAHKNTSKWAKRILKRGKNVDIDTRKALSAQLKRGDDLRKKMQGETNSDDDEQSETEDLVESARKVLEDVEDDDGNNPVQGKGLFKLAFMQRGIEKQREKAKEEARALLRELESNEQNMNDDYDEAVRYDSEEEAERKANKTAKVASKEDMKEVLDDGALVATSLKFGKSNAVSMSGGIDIDIGTSPKDDGNNTHAISEYTSTINVAQPDDDPVVNEEEDHDKKLSANKKASSKTKRKEVPADAEELGTSDNPWINSSQTHAKAAENVDKPKAHDKKLKKPPTKTGVVDVDNVLDVLDGSFEAEKKDKQNKNNEESCHEEKKITMLSQEELVRRAFATQSEQEIEEEFAREKAEVSDEENDIKSSSRAKKEKDLATVSGWGSWAGQGTENMKKSTRVLPKHLQPPPKKEPKRKRQDARRPHVIIREKRMKKTADKYMLKSIPYPYKSREEYERAMRGAIGKEWNVSQSVKEMTRPEIQKRAGKVIQPLSIKVKQKRAPAKF